MQSDWLENGYIIVRGALDVSEASDELKDLVEGSGTDFIHDFGNGGVAEFPCSPALDQVTVHPKLLWIVRECLATQDILLTQSVAWAKHGGVGSNSDQRMHMDFGNHYWGIPPKDPNMIAAIVYYSDTNETGGATALVPRNGNEDLYCDGFRHMPGIGGIPFENDRKSAELMISKVSPDSAALRQQCYEREIVPTFKPGDVLFYRMDTWHRGTPVNDGQVRYVHSLCWSKSNANGIERWNPSPTRSMYSGDFERFISQLKPDQLSSIGFPARDSPLWKDEEYCAGVRHRYEWAGFDLNKYIIMPESPPRVPEFWFFSKHMLYGAEKSASDFRDDIFAELNRLGAYAEVADSNWHWSIHYCEGPHYIVADMFIFVSKGQAIADLNMLSGNRYVWSELYQNIRQKREAIPYDWGPFPNTRPSAIPTLRDNHDIIGIDLLRTIGHDQVPEVVLPFLSNEDPNVVRVAMYRLTYFDRPPKNCSLIQKWLTKPLHGYLERETAKHARVVMSKQSKL